MKHLSDWQQQRSYRRSIEKALRQLRERWKADLNWDPEQHSGPYPLITWSRPRAVVG